MVRWLRWHCPPDTGFEIRALAVWGRARYLSVTEAPHNTNFHTWMGKKHFCFFQTAETGNRTPDSGVKGSGANHYPRAPALLAVKKVRGQRPGPSSQPRMENLEVQCTEFLFFVCSIKIALCYRIAIESVSNKGQTSIRWLDVEWTTQYNGVLTMPMPASQQTRDIHPMVVLGHRLRRWPNIESTFGECLVFALLAHCVENSIRYLRLWWTGVNLSGPCWHEV